jgi:hypothetical protein
MKRLIDDARGIALAVIILIIVVLAAAAAAAWYFSSPGNNNNSTSNTAQGNAQTSTQQTIRDNWVKFFNGQTPATEKTALLQNGQQFAQVIEAESQSATAKATTVTVSTVKLNSGGKAATVTYTIYVDGKPTLKDQTGQAVKENGAWKVSDTAFCQLLQLSGNVPPNCPAGSSSQSTTSGSTNTTTNNTGSASSTTGTNGTEPKP